MRHSEDCYVDELFASAADAGAPLLQGEFSARLSSISTASPTNSILHLLEGSCRASPISRRFASRAASAPFRASSARARKFIVARLPLREALARIAKLYRALPSHPHRSHRRRRESVFGQPCSSTAIRCPRPLQSCRRAAVPDIVIGDRHGVTTTAAEVDRLEHLLRGHGLRVQRNRPYAGGFITELRPPVTRVSCRADRGQPGALSRTSERCAHAAPAFGRH